MSVSIATRRELSGAVVITVRGEVELQAASRIHDAVREEIGRHRPALIYLDLGLVTFMANGAVAVLVASHQTARNGGTRLVIRNPSPFVRRLVEVFDIQIQLT